MTDSDENGGDSRDRGAPGDDFRDQGDEVDSEQPPGASVAPPPPEEDPAADAFQEVDVGEVDDDAVVAALAGDADPAPEEAPDEVVIPKRKYCERCEHFAPPPDATCTNPGTEILELVDMEHFTVRNCPVVAERRRIGATDIREPEE